MFSGQCPLFSRVWIFCSVLIASGIWTLFLINSVHRDQNVLDMKEDWLDPEEPWSTKALQRPTSGPKRSTIVLVVASMRTGSSLIGNIIQHSPTVFYVFEPLYGTQKLIDSGLIKTVAINGTFIKLRRKRTQQETMEAIFTCEFSKLDIFTLRQRHMTLSDSTREFYNCSESGGTLQNLKKCMAVMEDRCRSSDVISAKVIRLKMANVNHFLSKFQEVKIVHLIRDPRGRLPSARRTGKFRGRFINASLAKSECEGLTKDYNTAKALKTKFPGRLYTMRYEDLALRPLEKSRELYDFIGLPFTDDVKDFVRDITLNNITNCGAMCTTKNSTYTVFKWRNYLTPTEISTIDNNCLHFYRVAGYLPLERSEIDDLSVSPVADLPEVLKWHPEFV